jgi:hypothetical protein
MRSVLQERLTEQREIGGHFATGSARIVRTVVGQVCKAIWGDCTDAKVAVICDCSVRNARRYLSGELPLPVQLLVAINVELTKRFD